MSAEGNFDRLKRLIASSVIDTKNHSEGWAYPRGWNQSLEHVLALIAKIEKGQA